MLLIIALIVGIVFGIIIPAPKTPARPKRLSNIRARNRLSLMDEMVLDGEVNNHSFYDLL